MNKIYNKWDNEIMVSTGGKYIYIRCNSDKQIQPLLNRMNTDTCYLSNFTENDDSEGAILTFKLCNCDELKPELN
ncbi:MAG: hypothetical protein H8E03_00370 [Pelagibacteraceae bacterium]|nr:hypothetical protein [Pelagibacteraceae bacterium]